MNEYIALAQFFVIAPVCQFLLQSPRINQNSRQRGLIYAILFLLVTALLLTYLTLSSSPPSYYSLLSTPTTSSLADLKRAYKTAAIRLHPDKNPDASAAADFALLTRAYETLEKPESRTLYDRYGPRASDSASMPATAQFVQQSMMDAGLWYVTWIGLTYILCLSRDSLLGRNAAWTLLFLTGLAEYYLVYGGWQPLSAVLPYSPAFQKVLYLRSLYPYLMNAARLLSQFVYTDYETLHRALMRDILTSNVLILDSLRQLQATVERGGVGGVGVGDGREVVDDGSGTGALPLHLRLRNEQSRMAALQAQVSKGEGKGRGMASWLIPIALMVAFNYLGRGGGGSGAQS